MPPSSKFKPLDWITLSHEVSHAYFQRFRFTELQEKFLNLLWSKIGEEEKMLQLRNSVQE